MPSLYSGQELLSLFEWLNHVISPRPKMLMSSMRAAISTLDQL